MRVIEVKARYLHGTGKNTRMFHLINPIETRSWVTSGPDGWAGLTLYTACGVRDQMTSTPTIHDSMTLAVDPPKGLRPCPRCFARWEKLGKPLTAEQWAERIKALRVLTSHAARAKKGKQK